jgi:hypothetical protein
MALPAPKQLPAQYKGLLRTNSWSTLVVWLLCAVAVIVAEIGVVAWITKDEVYGLIVGIGYLLFAALMARLAMLGLVVRQDDVKLRTVLKTRYLPWGEIDHFYLRGTIYSPSLRVKCRNGGEIGVVGLAARTRPEEERAEEIVRELNRRLEIERLRGEVASEASSGSK